MNNQSYEITVDTRKSISHSNIEFSQNNLNISELIFNITEDGTNFTLNDTDKIIVYFEKPDKTVVFQDKEVELLDKEKGKIKVLLTSQTLVKAGDVKGQISIERIEDGTRKRVNTYDFSFKVRSSIASNDSIESTNEFQIFDKIMVAGEKFKDFEDEDFDELIAAGELAKGALPKSGGTMTGNIDMDTSVGSKSKGYRWRDAAGTMYGLETSTTGELILYDYKAAARIWQYDPVAKRFTVLSDTNLLKKTGDTMTGTLGLERGSAETAVVFKKEGVDTAKLLDNDTLTALYCNDTKETIWRYAKARKTFDVVASNTNLVTKMKDGRATLTLTADATAPDVNIPVIATRRGNTVTLQGVISLNANATGQIVTTLPSDMSPVEDIFLQVLDYTGALQSVAIYKNGAVVFGTSAKGKAVRLFCTYVTN